MDRTQGGPREARPVGGRDYPRTWPEFQRFFGDEEACLAYLERLRWPRGFRCPACGGEDAWKSKRELWVCRACRVSDAACHSLSGCPIVPAKAPRSSRARVRSTKPSGSDRV